MRKLNYCWCCISSVLNTAEMDHKLELHKYRSSTSSKARTTSIWRSVNIPEKPSSEGFEFDSNCKYDYAPSQFYMFIEYVYTTHPAYIADGTVPNIGLSDHLPVFVLDENIAEYRKVQIIPLLNIVTSRIE